MELDITDFFTSENHAEFSGSVLERGHNAAAETWQNAIEHAQAKPLLRPDQIQDAKDFIISIGDWSDIEIAKWTDTDVNALAIQWIAGDIREAEDLCSTKDGEIDWQEYEKLSEDGQVNGNMFQANDGRIYYHMEAY